MLKRGIALTPVKFGISFNVNHFNQAGALVHVYTDGSVLVNHGGTEMGQGLNTKVAQVVAHELGVPLSARALQRHRHQQGRQHLGHRRLDRQRPERQGRAGRGAADPRAAGRAGRRSEHGVDAASVRFATAGACAADGVDLAFVELVGQAYLARVQLWSDGFYATPGLHWDRATLTGRPFFYFAYGAAVSEVIVDTLTGEWKLLRADLLHDAGKSLNPAIDIGQVEGAFIQGMGWLTMRRAGLAPEDRRAADARAQHLQDPDRQRRPRHLQRPAVRQRQRRGQHPPQQGGRRAAAAAAVLRVLRDPRCGVGGRWRQRRPGAVGAGHAGGDPAGGEFGGLRLHDRGQLADVQVRW